MKKWLNVEFESSCYKTLQFSNFTKDYKKALKAALPDGYILERYFVGHFNVSAFIKDTLSRYIYLSIQDVRYRRNYWYSCILIRTAINSKDYTGGPNSFTTLNTLKEDIQRLYKKRR